MCSELGIKDGHEAAQRHQLGLHPSAVCMEVGLRASSTSSAAASSFVMSVEMTMMPLSAADQAAAARVNEGQQPAGLTSSFSMRQAKHQKASASSRMTHSSGAARSDMPCACNRA